MGAGQVPLPKIVIEIPEKQNPFVVIVDQILAITGGNNYSDDPAKQVNVKELGRQIDQLVYQLYELTPEEIAVVEGGKVRNS